MVAPIWGCPRARGCLRGICEVLASGPALEPSQEPPLFVAFREWMKQQRGTSDSTLADYGLPIRALLARLGDDPSSFDAQGLRQFVLEASRRSGWATAKRYTTALRMFLRFLISEGTCA